jgi:uncharacterized protein CbrC (UPF0167 family)
MFFIVFRAKGAVKLTGNGLVGRVIAANRLVRLCEATDALGSMAILSEHRADSSLAGTFVCEMCARPSGFAEELCLAVAGRTENFPTSFFEIFLRLCRHTVCALGDAGHRETRNQTGLAG